MWWTEDVTKRRMQERFAPLERRLDLIETTTEAMKLPTRFPGN